MSLMKNAIACFSIVALAAPILASGATGVVSAATTNNTTTVKKARPNSELKVPFRDANSIFNLRIDKHKGVMF